MKEEVSSIVLQVFMKTMFLLKSTSDEMRKYKYTWYVTVGCFGFTSIANRLRHTRKAFRNDVHKCMFSTGPEYHIRDMYEYEYCTFHVSARDTLCIRFSQDMHGV